MRQHDHQRLRDHVRRVFGKSCGIEDGWITYRCDPPYDDVKLCVLPTEAEAIQILRQMDDWPRKVRPWCWSEIQRRRDVFLSKSASHAGT